MDYIHIKNIEEYNPGYKDRSHIWSKIYWKIFIDEDYQALSEIDRHRLIGLIVFETYNQKPVALTSVNLALMGWNIKKQPISLTLQMLHKFIEMRNENVTQSRVEKSRVEKKREEGFSFDEVYLKYPNRVGKKDALKHFEATVKTEKDFQDIKTALENYLNSDRVKKGFIQNASTWFNQWRDWIGEPKKEYLPPDKDCKACNGTGKLLTGEGQVIKCKCVRER